MKPAPFEYARPESVDEAVRLLGQSDGEGRLLAGGQSLVPMLNMRLVQPRVVIDLSRLSELTGIARVDGRVTIGALVRYSDLERSETISRHLPLMADAVRYIGDRLIRNRGTLGGSLAQADPSGEMPLVALALDAAVTAVSPRGAREIRVVDLLDGPYETSLADDEMITEVSFPDGAGTFHAFEELARRHGDYAVIAAGAVGERAGDDTWEWVRIALGAAGPTALVVDDASDALAGSILDDADIDRAAEACAAAADPGDDVRASAEYRRHLVPVYVRRVLTSLRARAEEAA